MLHKLATFLAFICLGLTGCRTLHSDQRENSVPVATWFGLAAVDKDGRTVSPAPDKLVAKVLQDAGIAATVDDSGLHVAPENASRAREVLLIDKRLADSGVLVILALPAGTGRKTANGIEFPALPPAAVANKWFTPGCHGLLAGHATCRINRYGGDRSRTSMGCWSATKRLGIISPRDHL